MHSWPETGQATHFPPLVAGISFRSEDQPPVRARRPELLIAREGRALSLPSSQVLLLQKVPFNGLCWPGGSEGKWAAWSSVSWESLRVPAQ